MSEIIDTFVTTGGTRWSKKRDSLGRTYYHKHGEGRKSAKAFAAASSHKPSVSAFKRGEIDVSSVEQLGEPFTSDRSDFEGVIGQLRGDTIPLNNLDFGSELRFRASEINRWVGFRDKWRQAFPSMSDVEISEAYSDMQRELREADSPEAEMRIKRKFNIGGS